MTVTAQAAQRELKAERAKSTNREGEMEVLKNTLQSKENQIKDLNTEIKTHEEIMGKAFSSDGNGKDDFTVKLKEMKAKHNAILKEKNDELRSLKSTVVVLENDIGEQKADKEKLENCLNASKLESERLQNINELLVQKAKGDKTSVETAQSDIMGKGKKSNGRNVKENEDCLGLDPDLNFRSCSSLGENGKEFKPVCITKFREGVCRDNECQKVKMA